MRGQKGNNCILNRAKTWALDVAIAPNLWQQNHLPCLAHEITVRRLRFVARRMDCEVSLPPPPDRGADARRQMKRLPIAKRAQNSDSGSFFAQAFPWPRKVAGIKGF